MGNASSSKERQDDSVDYGYLTPVGVYTGPQDWNHNVVTQLIIERKLAPFYRPLEEYDASWDDEQILANRKELPADTTPPPTASSDGSASGHPAVHPSAPTSHTHTGSINKHSKHHPRASSGKDPQKFSEAAIYRGAVECPICFMYYPPNINKSRCCDHPICTECFVQIKRADPTATHLVSEPAECPYCVQSNFGVAYQPPPWRAGIGSETIVPNRPELSKANSVSSAETTSSRGKRRSISHTSKEVVTTDQIRPDWEAKLAAVRAAVTRRANRRIIMRQVGDRLIPVGVTSGRVHALPQDGDPSAPIIGEDPRRGSRRGRNQDLTQLLGTMGLAGQDLEDLMIMEAMRLSLIDHEDHQRREAAARNNAQATDGAAPSSASAIPIPGASGRGSHAGTPSSAALSSALPPSMPSTPSTPPHIPPPRVSATSALGRAVAATALAVACPTSAGANASTPHLHEPATHSHRRTTSLPPSSLAPAVVPRDAPSAAATSQAQTGTSHETAEPSPGSAKPEVSEPAVPPGLADGGGGSRPSADAPQITVDAPCDNDVDHSDLAGRADSGASSPAEPSASAQSTPDVGDIGTTAVKDPLAQMHEATAAHEDSGIDSQHVF